MAFLQLSTVVFLSLEAGDRVRLRVAKTSSDGVSNVDICGYKLHD